MAVKSIDRLVIALTELTEEHKLVEHEKNIYIPSLFYSETKAVQILHRLMNHKDQVKQFEQSEVLMAIVSGNLV